MALFPKVAIFTAAAALQPAQPVPAIRAEANLGEYITQADYPTEALLENEQGNVVFELSVSSLGRVTGCRIISSSASQRLNEVTCRALQRAQFRPARDTQGVPVADIIRSQITWAIPEPPPLRARARRANLASYVGDGDYPFTAIRNNEQGVVYFALEVSAEGRVSRCHITRSSGSQALDNQTCHIMMRHARFDPARDEAGNPVPDIVQSRITWRLR
ncbi:MAG: energy transducer TonB [Sphingosinicella sp.]